MPNKNPKEAAAAAATRTACTLASPYNQCPTSRLWRAAPGRLAAAAVGLSLSLALGGCSYQLGALSGKEAGKSEHSGSIAAQPVAAKVTESAAEGDLALAKRAATELLARGAKDASQSWENPRTGARGTVTPLASAYAQGSTVCQDFLASYVRGDQESWYQGGACRQGSTWEVRDLRPLQRT